MPLIFSLVMNVISLSDKMLSKLKGEFEAFLPHPSTFTTEGSTWKVYMVEADDKRDLLSMCSFAYSNQMFHLNMHSILLLLVSLPVGSCSCEQPFSALSRLKTWCQRSMAEEWLDSSAIGCINQERSPSPEEVFRVWDCSGHGRILLPF